MEWTQTEKAKKPAEKAPAKQQQQQQQPQQKQINIKDLSVQQLQNVGSKYIYSNTCSISSVLNQSGPLIKRGYILDGYKIDHRDSEWFVNSINVSPLNYSYPFLDGFHFRWLNVMLSG